MKIPVVKLEVYKKTGNESEGYKYDEYKDSSGVVIPNYTIAGFFNLQSSFGIQTRKDSIKFKLLNHRSLQNDGTYNYDFPSRYNIEIKDLVKLYAYYDPLPGGKTFSQLTSSEKDNYLIMSAYVKSFDYDSTASVGTFNFVCFNRTEVLLNSFMFARYGSGTRDVPFMITDSIAKLELYNKNDRVYAFKDYSGLAVPGVKGAYRAIGTKVEVGDDEVLNTEWDGTGNIRAYKKALYKLEGGEWIIDEDLLVGGEVPSEYMFPLKAFSESYKPFIEQLEDLSDKEWTGESLAGTYLSYVDTANNLHWRPKDFDNVTYVSESDTSSIKLSKDADDVVNAIILNCGTDPDERGITTFAYNSTSMGKYGARWKFIARTDIAETIRQNEIKSGYRVTDDNLIITTGDNAPDNTIGSNNYPMTVSGSDFPSSGWVVQSAGGDDSDGIPYVPGSSSVYSEKDYKLYFRNTAKAQGVAIGEGITHFADEAKYKGNWELKHGTLDYVAGDMLEITIPSLNITTATGIKLRCVAVNHAFNNGVWTTILEIEEDPDYKLVSGVSK